MKLLIGSLGKSLSAVLFYSPAWLRTALAWFLAFLWFDVFRIRRQVVLGNLRTAFPEWSDKKRVDVARTSLRCLGLGFLEYGFLPFLNKNNYRDIFEFHGLELVEEALADGRGLLILTLHMGNGDLAMAGLALHGIPIAVVTKEFKLKWLNELWFGLRERLGITLIPARNSSFALLKALKKNQMVVIPLDQFTGPPIGVRTTFFGKETGTAAGLAVMAQRSGAPVISVYTYRTPQGKHAVHFVRRMNTGGEVGQVTQGFTDELESFVRLHPTQWMWLHKRWKKFVVH